MNCIKLGKVVGQKLEKTHYSPSSFSKSTKTWLSCSLRGRRDNDSINNGRVSSEAIQAIQALKLSKSNPSTLDHLLDTKLSRLLKSDLLHTISILRHQNQLHLSLLVFNYIQKEEWYKPDLFLYHDMIRLLGKNKKIELAEQFFAKLEEEGLKPDTRAFAEMIGAYLQVGMIDEAMQMYATLKESGCTPDEFTFAVLIRNLEDAGRDDLADGIKEECRLYMDYPGKFLEKLKKKHTKKASLKLV